MGKSAIKIARDTAARNYVEPKADKNGYKQPAYVRGSTAIQTSKKLNWHKTCVAGELVGKKFPDRGAVREALTKTAESCSSKNPY